MIVLNALAKWQAVSSMMRLPVLRRVASFLLSVAPSWQRVGAAVARRVLNLFAPKALTLENMVYVALRLRVVRGRYVPTVTTIVLRGKVVMCL